jgi:hypothetical protein
VANIGIVLSFSLLFIDCKSTRSYPLPFAF